MRLCATRSGDRGAWLFSSRTLAAGSRVPSLATGTPFAVGPAMRPPRSDPGGADPPTCSSAHLDSTDDLRSTTSAVAIQQEMQKALDHAHRRVLVETIRGNANMTLSDLARLARGKLRDVLGNVTVGELMGGAASPPSKGSPRSNGTPRGVDTRTPAARKRYDNNILEALQAAGDWRNAQQLRGLAGGTPLQARKALNRLIEAGKIEFSGKARATSYRSKR